MPVLAGVNVTVTVQVPGAATTPPARHVPPGATAKSPVAAMPVTVSPAAPVLIRVTVSAGLVVPTALPGKLRVPGDTEAETVAPLPDRGTSWWLTAEAASSLNLSVPDAGPAVVGANVTSTVHVP